MNLVLCRGVHHFCNTVKATARQTATTWSHQQQLLRSKIVLSSTASLSFPSPPRCCNYSNTPLDEDDIAVKTSAGIGNVKDHMIPAPERLFQHCRHPRTVSIIGAPMTFGQPYVGTDSGPRLLRQAGLLSMLSELGWRVEDLPDLNFDAIAAGAPPPSASSSWSGKAKNVEMVGPGTAALAQLVAEKVRQGRFPLIIGGDHSIGIGSLAGILQVRPNTGVIWIDAHADLHIPATSESGNMHGMPVGMHMDGLVDPVVSTPSTLASQGSTAPSSIPGFEWIAQVPRLAPDSIVYVGLRDVDVAERAAIRRLGIKAFTMHEIDRYGIGQTMEMALGHLLQADRHRPLHLSYDIDAIDPILAPATGTTVRGGLTFREAHYVAEAVAASGNLASAEMVELNPNLSDGKGAQDTIDLGLQIVTSIMGNSLI